jgi:hypothetical protein
LVTVKVIVAMDMALVMVMAKGFVMIRDGQARAAAQVPEGYRYVGPCRCGWGPNAFYRDASGRIVHTWDVYRWRGAAGSAPAREVLKEEFEALKAQKEDLERRLAELEKRLKEETEEPEKQE